MTSNQIRKVLTLAKVNLENLTIGRDCVKVYVRDNEGYCDFEAIGQLVEQVKGVLNWGGYSTGSGAWVLDKSYTVATSEYCSMTSSHHY
ncbi:hypothetical protein ROV06_004969 [Serratia marcescens]|nr:hypothetical protein [Serratia marcescens]